MIKRCTLGVSTAGEAVLGSKWRALYLSWYSHGLDAARGLQAETQPSLYSILLVHSPFDRTLHKHLLTPPMQRRLRTEDSILYQPCLAMKILAYIQYSTVLCLTHGSLRCILLADCRLIAWPCSRITVPDSLARSVSLQMLGTNNPAAAVLSEQVPYSVTM